MDQVGWAEEDTKARQDSAGQGTQDRQAEHGSVGRLGSLGR